MKVLKENLTLVICGAIVLLAAAFAWYAHGPMRDPLIADMNSRLNERSTIDQLAQTQLDWPGATTPQHGPPTREMIKAREDLIKNINAEQKKVLEESVKLNSQGRITANGVPLLPLVTGPKPEAGFLPHSGVNAIPQAFKQDYLSQFKLATSLLAFGQPANGRMQEVELDSATPPDETKLKEEWDQNLQKRAGNPGMPGVGMQPDPKEQVNFERTRVLNKATELRMYLDPQAFQIRSWGLGAEAPNEQQIFEAMVDSWLQGDVIKAINALNTRALGPSTKDISKAPIKRLIHIAVGNSARGKVGTAPTNPFTNNGMTPTIVPGGDTGDLFFTSQTALSAVGMPVTGPPVNGGAAPAQPAAPNTVDPELSMTGHASGGDYDVVQMSIWMDIDPAYLNDFVDQLYRQNMGYTVLATRFRTVDPLERTSNGFMYGESQAIEVQLQVEAVLFRGWTTALMPDSIKNLLGIPLGAPPK
jgi:hypothetical protein